MIATSPYPAPERRLAITIVVMAASIMQILDTTIANVALPHMRATLGATQEQISWVITSYVVATAIAIPATGFIESQIGRRNLFLLSLFGFIVASAACGLAGSLEMMVISRVLQGGFGAFISPLGQAIIYDTYPVEERPKAMTIWGMGVMIAPIIGPVLGGWLTDQISWRWVYFINIPIGIVTLTFAANLLDRSRIAKRAFDWMGYGLIALGLAALQLALDRGTNQDWFSSTEIIFEAAIAVGALWMFGVHTATARNPLIPRRAFADRNMMVACSFAFICSGAMIGAATLVSLMVQGLMGYGTIDAGLVGLPRGLMMAATMFLTGRLSTYVDGRIFMGLGVVTVSIGFWLMSGFAIGMDRSLILLSGAVQGLGFGMIMLPMNLLGFATMPPQLRTEAAALYALSRNMGTSVLISIATALISYNVQISHSDQAAHITNETVPILNSGLFEQLGFQGRALLSAIDMSINAQALMIAYIDVFWVLAWITLLILPALFFAKKSVPAPMTAPGRSSSDMTAGTVK